MEKISPELSSFSLNGTHSSMHRMSLPLPSFLLPPDLTAGSIDGRYCHTNCLRLCLPSNSSSERDRRSLYPAPCRQILCLGLPVRHRDPSDWFGLWTRGDHQVARLSPDRGEESLELAPSEITSKEDLLRSFEDRLRLFVARELMRCSREVTNRTESDENWCPLDPSS
jgi:hypothetical protein